MIHPKSKNSRFWFFVFGVLGIVISAQLIVSNLSAGKGERLTVLEKRAGWLLRENQNLQEELAQNSSLTKIAQDAANSGFAKPENIMYLDAANPVAQASP